jgi:hypothetical protein
MHFADWKLRGCEQSWIFYPLSHVHIGQLSLRTWYGYLRIQLLEDIRTTVQYDPPEPEMSGIGLGHLGHVFGSLFSNNQTAITIQHIGLVYLFIITLALLIGISLLLYQQLALVYEGQTYLDSLSPVNDDTSKKGWANLQRVLGKRYPWLWLLPYISSKKFHAR